MLSCTVLSRTASEQLIDNDSSLTHIMGDALDQLYGQNLGFRNHLPMSETLDRIFGLCWKLAHWQDTLPPALQIINTSKEAVSDVPLTVGTARFRVLLSLRYLGAKILIIRPILRKFLDMGSKAVVSHEHRSEWLVNSGAGLLAELVRTCRSVLKISKSILLGSKSDQNLLGAWWFSCFYSQSIPVCCLPWLHFTHRCSSIQCFSCNSRRASHQENPCVFRGILNVFDLGAPDPCRHSHRYPSRPRPRQRDAHKMSGHSVQVPRLH